MLHSSAKIYICGRVFEICPPWLQRRATRKIDASEWWLLCLALVVANSRLATDCCCTFGLAEKKKGFAGK
jgi:hypothetical protein